MDQQFIVGRAAIGIVEMMAVDELDTRMRTEVDSGERMARRVDPPFVEVIVDGVAHQNLLVGGLVVEVARGHELDVVSSGAEIHALQCVARGIDPPVVQMMIDLVEDQSGPTEIILIR